MNKLSNIQQINHNECLICPDCKSEFIENNKKVTHHDHITGDFIKTICSKCNLNYKIQKFIPIYLHNLKEYDSHFIVPALANYGYQGNDNDKSNITAIPSNEEKYISFRKDIKVAETIIKYKEPTPNQQYHIENKTDLGLKLSKQFENKDDIIKPIYFEMRFLDSLAFMSDS